MTAALSVGSAGGISRRRSTHLRPRLAAWVTVGLALTTIPAGVAVSHAAEPGGWGRTGATCYLNLEGGNEYRYNIIDIKGSPTDGTLRFTRVLERWHPQTQLYRWQTATEVGYAPGAATTKFFEEPTADQACKFVFSKRTSDQPLNTALFTHGSWT